VNKRPITHLSGALAAAAVLALGAAVPAAAAPGAGGDCRANGTVGAAGATNSCPGVRPGAVVRSGGAQCTMNFLFRSNRHRYVGTAGHCILDRDGEQSWGRRGPVARRANGTAIGRYAYAVLGGERDFALIRLRGGVQASPRMCQFGGPTGIDGSTPSDPVVLQHYGQGVGTGQTTPGRLFTAAQGMPDRDEVFAQGTVAFGDSGGPVTRRGSDKAIGLVVSTGAHFGRFREGAGTVGITRLPPQLRRAEQVLSERISLATAAAP
jgi:hypothetical protein